MPADPGVLSLTVTPEAGRSFAIAIRDHVVHVDQAVEDGGADSAPTPLELLLASLASCVAHYARGYLVRHGLSETGLAVHAQGVLAKGPARLDDIVVSVTFPVSLPEDKQDALLAVASHCTVHNTLHAHPDVQVVGTAHPSIP